MQESNNFEEKETGVIKEKDWCERRKDEKVKGRKGKDGESDEPQ